MACERWLKGFTPYGKPVVHYENDGPAYLRKEYQSDDEHTWRELAFLNETIFLQALRLMLEEVEKGNHKPLNSLVDELVETKR